MARTALELGAYLDMVSPAELETIIAKQAQAYFQQYARGIKYLRFGPFPTTIAANAFSFDGSGGDQNLAAGPREGFVWSIRRLLVTGLGTGSTPDVINFYRNKPTGIPFWQLNGNSFGQTFGKIEMLLLGGETLCFANSGSVTATGQVTVSGDVIEVAAEELFKLVS